jgi:predicted alpha/beta superfamily hydrolase
MLETLETTITPLGRERTVRVLLPPGYEAGGERFPVLYMHDGQNLFRDEDASFGTSWGVADHLARHGPGLIVVGIDSPRDLRRIDELAPWPNRSAAAGLHPEPDVGIGGEGGTYVNWIVNELKPTIDGRYRTRPDDTSMAGSSLGGLITLYAACQHPTTFRRIAAVSNAFWFNQAEIEDLVRRSDLAALERVYLDVGTDEASGDAFGPDAYVASNRAVHRWLEGRVPRLRFDVVEGARHDEAAWRDRLGSIFDFLYGP